LQTCERCGSSALSFLCDPSRFLRADHCRSSCSVSSVSGLSRGSCSPLRSPLLNSIIPLPSDLPTSGRRRPKISKAASKTTIISVGPMLKKPIVNNASATILPISARFHTQNYIPDFELGNQKPEISRRLATNSQMPTAHRPVGRCYAASEPSSSGDSSLPNLTATFFETPASCIVIPYSTSA